MIGRSKPSPGPPQPRVIQTLKGAPPPRTLAGYLQTDLALQRARLGVPVVDLDRYGPHGEPAPPNIVAQVNAFTQRARATGARQRRARPRATRARMVQQFNRKPAG